MYFPETGFTNLPPIKFSNVMGSVAARMLLNWPMSVRLNADRMNILFQ